MANCANPSCCPSCGLFVVTPDHAHDGCGGHALCPFCGHDLPPSYHKPAARVVDLAPTWEAPADG